MTTKRIKECIVCGEIFRDNTRPGNKKTCSPECADEARKARQRKQYRVNNPKKPNQREIYYYDHLEYPFWLDEKIGDNWAWKIAIPYDPQKIEFIIGVKQIQEFHGGRKRGQATIDKTQVRFAEHDDKKPSEVIEYKMTPEELAEYLEKLACRKKYI